MEVKVECSCGTRYKFDVEPVNGLMPVPVSCPSCGVDGTPIANAAILQTLGVQPAAPAQPQGTERPRIRLSASAPPAPQAAVTPPALPVPPPPQPHTPTGIDAQRIAMLSGKPSDKVRNIPKVFAEPNAKKGLAGAIIGGLIVTTIWFVLWKSTGSKFGIMAIAVGWVTGFCARWMGRTEGQKMAMTTAGVALAFIVIFQFVYATAETAQLKSALGLNNTEIESSYQKDLANAQKLVAAVPTGSDDEIRRYLAQRWADPGERPNLEAISVAEIKDFRDDDLKSARELAQGKKTKANYVAEMKKTNDEIGKSPIFRIIFWIKAIGIFSIVWIIIGVALAYRFGYGEG